MALLNLTVNARDAMPNGGQIVVATREESILAGDATGLEPGRYICLTVSDTGAGMDQATLKRATEPFFTTKGPDKGTGLGLSMVHGLAEQCGGRFTLQSREGEGTTAELWLPVAETQIHAIDNIQLLAGDAVADRGTLVVVAVDDDGLVLTNTTAMLEDLGHTVFPASSGKEAIDILRNVEGIRFCYFDEGDVVRHHLVQRIIRAYDDFKGRNEQLPLTLENRNGYSAARSNNGQVPSSSPQREASVPEVPLADTSPPVQDRAAE